MYLFRMPKFGLDMETGTIEAWYVEKNEAVNKGDILAEISTQKITNEVESPVDGFIKKIVGEVGKEYKVGEVIAYIAESKEELEEEVPQVEKEVTQKAEHIEEKGVKTSRKIEETTFIKASPIAKKLARQHNVNLKQIAGSGPGGRIVESDVLEFIEKRKVTTGDKSRRLSNQRDEFVEEKLSTMRKAIAQNLSKSFHEAVVITNTTEIDMTEFLKVKKELSAKEKVTVTAMLVKVVAKVLQIHQDFNAHFQNDTLKKFKMVNIGFALDTEDGLLVPVIKNADGLSLVEINKKLSEFVEKARSKRITQDDLTGSGFTITNLGMMRTEIFTPALNGREVAILGVGRAKREVKVSDLDNGIVIRDMEWFSLSYDHRVIDGAKAARFLATLAELIENPSWVKN